MAEKNLFKALGGMPKKYGIFDKIPIKSEIYRLFMEEQIKKKSINLSEEEREKKIDELSEEFLTKNNITSEDIMEMSEEKVALLKEELSEYIKDNI